MPKRKAAKKTAKAKTKLKPKVAKKKATKSKARPAAKKTNLAKKTSAAVPLTSVTETTRIGAGDQAPAFNLPDQNGQNVSLSDFAGKKVVLYFYPKDDTPGCTKESCSFRDNLPHFDAKEAVILGVSFDDADSHQKFISKYGLNFHLLSDLNKEVAKKYGVYVQKNMYGNISWGIERSTFIIDREGKIIAAIRRVQVDGHTEEVLSILNTIQ
ncbi:MAG: thioredoxin-dependent thiol peroxidase [Deltaproteobacteria bacterium]|nr:thioredoxin-dependent thiol peroxidase [Deltaproteobacteria bacterium]